MCAVEWKKLGDVCKIMNGKDYKSLNDGNIPVYGSGGIMTFVDTFVYNRPSVLLPRKGSLNNVFYVDKPFWTVDTIYWTNINEGIITPKYFFYYMDMQDLEKLNVASGAVPSLTQTILNKINIPIPSLAKQQEIVSHLDTFTTLISNLESELDMRCKQYEHYRNQLLNFEGVEGVEWKTLGDVGNVCMCKRIMKEETSEQGDIPFFKIGTFGGKADAYISNELYEKYKKEYSFPKKGDILISASGTIGRLVVFDGKDAYFQDSNIVWIDNDENLVYNAYLKYYYQIVEWKTDGGTIKRLYNNNLRATRIAIPSKQTQQEIVEKLDAFENLIQSLEQEIKLRKQQYEYYREKLLTFEKE